MSSHEVHRLQIHGCIFTDYYSKWKNRVNLKGQVVFEGIYTHKWNIILFTCSSICTWKKILKKFLGWAHCSFKMFWKNFVQVSAIKTAVQKKPFTDVSGRVVRSRLQNRGLYAFREPGFTEGLVAVFFRFIFRRRASELAETEELPLSPCDEMRFVWMNKVGVSGGPGSGWGFGRGGVVTWWLDLSDGVVGGGSAEGRWLDSIPEDDVLIDEDVLLSLPEITKFKCVQFMQWPVSSDMELI